jgi:sugar-specific transcriptional regulator TrmB
LGEHTKSEENEDVEILNSLGLKLSEAKVFSALSELGVSTASTISKASDMAREFVYQTLPNLIKKGLVEEIITSPKKFKAIPLKDAYTVLLKRKEKENRKLYSKAMKALKNHQNKPSPQVAADPQIRLVPSHELPDTRIGQEYENVQESIELIFPMNKFIQWSQYYAEIGIEEVIKKNVKMRIITQQSLLKIFAARPELFTHSFKSKLKCIDFRYVQKPFSVEMMIFDRKTLFVSTIEENNINKMIWLRTNNPLMLEMANGYFEAMWERARESLS